MLRNSSISKAFGVCLGLMLLSVCSLAGRAEAADSSQKFSIAYKGVTDIQNLTVNGLEQKVVTEDFDTKFLGAPANIKPGQVKLVKTSYYVQTSAKAKLKLILTQYQFLGKSWTIDRASYRPQYGVKVKKDSMLAFFLKSNTVNKLRAIKVNLKGISNLLAKNGAGDGTWEDLGAYSGSVN